MTKDPLTITPDALLEDAALLMRENKISALPVVEGDDTLIGIITESDIFDAFLDLMGFRDMGTRITIQARNEPGVLANVTAIFHSFKFNINHIAVYGGSSAVCDVVIRFNAFNTEELEKVLEERDYKIVHILRSQEELD
jgi:acetoin utilization protein AcuB